MSVKFNPFTAQLQLDQVGAGGGGGGGGSSYLDGEVEAYNDLPLDSSAALNSAWLVRSSSGIWPFNKPGGIYIRTATAGSSRDADFTYAGTMPDVFSDAVLTIYDEASTTRTGQFNLGSITAGQNRVLTWPNASGTIALTSDITSGVTSVTGTAPISSSGGTTPAISISAATTSAAGSMSSADKTKLDGIASGAGVNVQANWTESNNGLDSFILNKPNLGGAAALNVGTTAGTVAAGDDARFSDSRTPTSHAASHAAAGSDPLFDQDLNSDDDVAFNQITVTGSVNFDGASLNDFAFSTSLAIKEPANEHTGTFRAQGDSLTANRTYDLPDASGTLALTSDIPANTIASTIVDAKGDLLVGTAADTVARLAVGSTNGHVLTVDSAEASGMKWAAASGGGSGGTKTYAVFTATDNQPPATAFATYDTRSSIAVLDFDAATDENAVFVGIMPEAASLGSGLIVRLHWMATTATSGNVRWGVQFERSNTDLDADSFDTAVEATAAANGTSGILTTTAITVTTIDGITAGDVFRLKVYRNADDATNDTMTGDAELVAVELRSAA